MTEEQADMIISLLEQVRDGVENVSAAMIMWSDSGDVVKAIEGLKKEVKKISR